MDTKNTFRYEWKPYFVAIIAIAAAAALRVWPLQALGVHLAWLTFYPAVMVAALYGGFSAALLGTFLSCLAILFVLPPFVHGPFIRDSADWLGLAVFFATCTMISGIAEAMRRAQAREKQAQDERDRFFTLSLDLQCIAGFDGYFKRLNPAWEKTLGFTTAELTARPYVELIHPEDRESTLAEADKLSAGQVVISFENRYRCKDGSYKWLAWTCYPVPEAQLIYAAARDITEGKRAEDEIKKLNKTLQARAAELQESEKRYRLLFDESPQPVWVCDRETLAFLEVNEAAVRHYGYSRQEFLSMTLREIRPPEDVSSFEEYLSQRGHSERYAVATRRHRKKDGAIIDVEVYSYDLNFPARPARVALVYDVTERKRAEEALRLSEAKFRGLLKSAADGIVIVDHSGRIVLLNPQAERMFGYEPGELLGQHIEILVPERFRAEHGKQHDKYFASPIHEMGSGADVFALRKDGSEFPVSLMLSSFESDEGPLAMSVVRDISERKQAEAQMKQQAAELQALNKELEAFTYSVAHDLRSPLRRTDGFAQLLLDEYNAGLPEEARHYLHRVREGTRQMGQLVDDLLNLARVGRKEVSLQVAGLNSLVEEVVKELKRETEGRAMEWKIRPLPFVECDPALMKVVFTNLLSNAVKYTRPRQQAIVEIGTTEHEGRTAIYIRDNGVGFSMKYADKLFGVFQRLHRTEDFEGTGVGLATVQRIVHKHGGQIWAEAELDKGACFYFTLGTQPQIEPQGPSASEKESYAGKRS